MYKQRLHVQNFIKRFLNSIKLFLLFSTEISSTEYRDVLIPSHGGDSKTFKGMTST
jgi:hypothetical protein